MYKRENRVTLTPFFLYVCHTNLNFGSQIFTDGVTVWFADGFTIRFTDGADEIEDDLNAEYSIKKKKHQIKYFDSVTYYHFKCSWQIVAKNEVKRKKMSVYVFPFFAIFLFQFFQ